MVRTPSMTCLSFCAREMNSNDVRGALGAQNLPFPALVMPGNLMRIGFSSPYTSGFCRYFEIISLTSAGKPGCSLGL
jgi:hypothetical protein